MALEVSRSPVASGLGLTNLGVQRSGDQQHRPERPSRSERTNHFALDDSVLRSRGGALCEQGHQLGIHDDLSQDKKPFSGLMICPFFNEQPSA